MEGSDGQDELVVATTRLETMLGDTAVAVHPDDPRYKHLHGKFLVHPFHPDRKIPVILDPILVDMELGTGAVKITPAHDPNDYECGTRHQLPFITIFTDDGKMNEEAAQFEGLMRWVSFSAFSVIPVVWPCSLHIPARTIIEKKRRAPYDRVFCASAFPTCSCNYFICIFLLFRLLLLLCTSGSMPASPSRKPWTKWACCAKSTPSP